MAIFGFICGALILGFLTLCLIFIGVYDVKRGMSICWMLILLGLLACGWYQLINASPFTIAIN